MPRQPVLDPRHFRLDDLLRRPLLSGETMGSWGGDLSASTVSGWGFSGAATFRGVDIPAPMTISVWAEGAPVFPAEGVYRPSHVTVNAQDDDTGLQVSEDKFVGANDCLVSVLSLRNPGEWSIEVETRTQWGIAKGEHTDKDGAPFHVSRFAPPAPDRRFTLPAGGRIRLVFVLALAQDDRFARAAGDTARQQAEGYARDTSAVVAHMEGFDSWATRHVPRFDSPDPWATRAWYHDCFLRRKYPARVFDFAPDTPRTRADFVQEARTRFAEGDFDRLSDAHALFLPDLFARQVLRLTATGDTLSLTPAPDLRDWHYFAVENYEHAGRSLTIVWDDPETPGDAFDDGDKGFTIYDGDTVLHRQPDLSPFTVALRAASSTDDDDD